MRDKQRLKVGFLTPYFHEVRGNATTAKRIVAGLEQLGIEVVVFPYEEESFTTEVAKKLQSCDLLHILHFYRFATWQMKHQFSIEKPYIITSGGTDINHDLLDETKKQAMKTIIDNASAVTVFTADGKEKVADAFPNMKGKISVIPQSVWFPESNYEHSVELRDGFPKLLLPAGLRPVKDVLYVLEPLKKLQKEFPNLQFVIVGTILDQTVYEKVKEAEMTHPWLRFIKDVPLEKMPLYYKWADIVLNTSISEGQSSAIIEGMYFSKLIIARRNAGNVSVITDKRNGFLYDSPVDFQKRLKNVLLTMNNQAEVVLNGKRYVEEVHNHGKEMQQYFSLYEKII